MTPHPEYAHIIIAQYHRDLRSLAGTASPVEPGARAGHPVRRRLGETLVRLGVWLGGHALRSDPLLRPALHEP